MSDEPIVGFMNKLIVSDKKHLNSPKLEERLSEIKNRHVFNAQDALDILNRCIQEGDYVSFELMDMHSKEVLSNYVKPILFWLHADFSGENGNVSSKLVRMGLSCGDICEAPRALYSMLWSEGYRDTKKMRDFAKNLLQECDDFIDGDDGVDLESIRDFFDFYKNYHASARLRCIF
ncbi:hypothetical protein JW851_05160 [Candidatus Woesearchaeota archaeon]|nr:hypothetical protein [Candidatus Woesearchaeota archaeon]